MKKDGQNFPHKIPCTCFLAKQDGCTISFRLFSLAEHFTCRLFDCSMSFHRLTLFERSFLIELERLLCFREGFLCVVANEDHTSAYGFPWGIWLRWRNFLLIVTVTFSLLHPLSIFSASKHVVPSKFSPLKSTISSPFCKSPLTLREGEISAMKIGRSP